MLGPGAACGDTPALGEDNAQRLPNRRRRLPLSHFLKGVWSQGVIGMNALRIFRFTHYFRDPRCPSIKTVIRACPRAMINVSWGASGPGCLPILYEEPYTHSRKMLAYFRRLTPGYSGT